MIQPDAETLSGMTSAGTEAEITLPERTILASATDQRGVITYANPAFCDISGYDRAALIGAPHRIIRHPDMPRGLFHLYWERLKQNQTVAAYVKNRAADGRFYWVFALVIPIPDGFLSMRFKPRGPHFDTLRGIYSDILAREAGGATPEQGSAELLARVEALGFADYCGFMREALAGEYRSWCTAAGKTPPPMLEKIEAISDLTDSIAQLIRDIGDGFRNIRGEPVNMRILAGRLDGAGAAIGTISQNYEAMAGEMHQVIESMESPGSGALFRMRASIEQSKFATLLSVALQQTRRQAEKAAAQDAGHGAGFARLLRDHGEERLQDGVRAVGDTAAIGKEIDAFCRQLRRRINGLDVVKLLCRVENGRLGRSDSGLQGIIDRLESFHDQTEIYLADLATKAVRITAISASLR